MTVQITYLPGAGGVVFGAGGVGNSDDVSLLKSVIYCVTVLFEEAKASALRESLAEPSTEMSYHLLGSCFGSLGSLPFALVNSTEYFMYSSTKPGFDIPNFEMIGAIKGSLSSTGRLTVGN